MTTLTVTADEINSGVAYSENIKSNRYVSEIFTPSGFNWDASLPDIKIVKNGDKFECLTKPQDLVTFDGAQVVYVDAVNGSDSNSGNSWAFAKRSLDSGVDRAIADAAPTKIIVREGLFTRGTLISGFNTVKTLTAPLAIISSNGRAVNAVVDDLTWSVNATYPNVYEATRSTATSAINLNQTDSDGRPFVYKIASSLADCAATQGSFFTDGATVYTHAVGSVPVSDENCRVIIRSACCSIISDYDIYMYGLDFFGGRYGAFNVVAGASAKVVAENCRAMFAVDGTFSNPSYVDGFNIDGGLLFAAYSCDGSYNSKDGFNVSGNSGQVGHSLTVNCTGIKNGESYESSTSCNGITFHSGVTGIDVGSTWLQSYGTNAGFVNDNTQYWGVGVTAGHSDGDKSHGGGVDWGAFGVWSGAATMWLDSCNDVGASTGVYVSTVDGAKAYLRNHSGLGERVGDIEAY